MTRKQPDSNPKSPKATGPEPERLVLEGDWKDAVDRALRKPPSIDETTEKKPESQKPSDR